MAGVDDIDIAYTISRRECCDGGLVAHATLCSGEIWCVCCIMTGCGRRMFFEALAGNVVLGPFSLLVRPFRE